MELKSKMLCVTLARASKTSKGPTNVGMVKPRMGTFGKVNPKAFRLLVWLCSEIAPSTSGSSAARASADRASACWMDSTASFTRVLPSGASARSTACLRLNCSGACANEAGNKAATVKKRRLLSRMLHLRRHRSLQPRQQKRFQPADGSLDIGRIALAARKRPHNFSAADRMRNSAHHEKHSPDQLRPRQIRNGSFKGGKKARRDMRQVFFENLLR